ncbi:DNA translocase FtsK [Hassallia byssoidea VB512170]|uniref:DNA translocase FtsK n=1 Tax=Hassallia byssoidea VB512170 TaxID=1304833 RepID=A0A846H492_9CYAN|nr:DNA translocase FtsK [Hassalia byssoidea]NEU71808.1 DNA translocase FtsK [Hassalia byssoidea VB512170]
MDETQYNNEQIYQALVCLKAEGLSNQEISGYAKESFGFEQQNYVNAVLHELEFAEKLNRTITSYDHQYLFQLIYQAVISGMGEAKILEVCQNFCNLSDLAFAKLCLRYILINRIPGEYEIQVFEQDLYQMYREGKSYLDFVQLAENTENMHFKQLGYRAANLVAKATGEKISLPAATQIQQQGLSISNEASNTQSTSITGNVLVGVLQDFGIDCKYVDTKTGPTFNRVKVKLAKGVSFKKVQGLGNDLVQQLGDELKIENPPMISVVPGAVVFDIPRLDRKKAYFADYVKFSEEFDINFIVIPGGVDVDGTYVEIPLYDENVTHILGGGRTRGGKSQFERAAVLYLARRYPPGVVRLVLSDVKRVTFGCFDRLPHLIAPVAKDAIATLKLLEYLVAEQEFRYQEFERVSVEKVAQYNQMFPAAPMTRIVCLIDECFDLLSDPNCKDQIELMLMKLLAKAGAAGIHILLFTQRPDKDVIKPLIRSNCPAKVAFATSRPEDSGIILGDPDDNRAASLLGFGDMLYKSPLGVIRLQGVYLGDEKKDFEQYLEEAKNHASSVTPWNSGLDFASFNSSITLEKSTRLVTKVDQLEEFSSNITFDEATKSSIISLHKRGYELHEIVQELFELSRADGRRYKRLRDAVAEFISGLESSDDI